MFVLPENSFRRVAECAVRPDRLDQGLPIRPNHYAQTEDGFLIAMHPPKCENHAPVAPNEDNVVTERNRSEQARISNPGGGSQAAGFARLKGRHAATTENSRQARSATQTNNLAQRPFRRRDAPPGIQK